RAPGARDRAAAPSPRTPAPSPKDRLAASRSRTRCPWEARRGLRRAPRPRPPRRRRSCRSVGDRDAVAPGEIALDPHVAVAARVQPFADRVALGGTDLQDERA